MRYPVKLFYSKEDKGYIAILPDLRGSSAFGETPEEALKEIKIVEKMWLKVAAKEGMEIPMPSTEKQYSGRILARTPKTLHKQLAEFAEDEGVSLNQLVIFLLSEAVKSPSYKNITKRKKSHGKAKK